jgi:hypothetical protein
LSARPARKPPPRWLKVLGTAIGAVFRAAGVVLKAAFIVFGLACALGTVFCVLAVLSIGLFEIAVSVVHRL